ncbi:hypothetical protein [Kribbella sp. DT2]|uniref:hypothetical protein n=1 Tax=Kribbella sp. DT2 TaxID=3393427 RepID=UPI003CFA3B5E
MPMPSDGPAQWTTTLRSDGRLVLRAPNRFHVLQLIVYTGLLLTNGISTLDQLTGDEPWGPLAYFRAAFAIVALVVVVGFLSYLLTGAWTLTVDARGVTIGRHHLAWPDIADITGTDQKVLVRPHAGDTELRITGNTLKDPQAFARWLTTELESRR